MDSFLIILLGILVLAMLALIAYYNHLDRLRFRLDRLLKGAKPALEDWVEECEALQRGVSAAYKAAKGNWRKTACLQAMVTECRANSEEKLDIQEQMLEFCYRYSQLAEQYNQKLDTAGGQLARLLGFQPYSILDFYPDVHLPQGEKKKS